MVDELQVADEVVGFVEDRMEEGIFEIFVAPKEGKQERCREIILEELKNICENGVSSQEVDRSVAVSMTKFVGALESPSDFVMEWMSYFFATDDEQEVFKVPENYNRVTPGSVRDFISLHLDPFFMQQINLVSLPTGKRELWQASKLQEKRIEEKILTSHQRTAPLEEPKLSKTLSEPDDFEFDFPQPTETFTMSNGLRVVLRHDTSLPLVTASLRFRDSEPFSKSKEGIIVDLMMEMLLEGSARSTKQENVGALRTLGVKYSFDNSGAAMACLDANLEQALKTFFYILLEPDFKKDTFNKLKGRVISGLQRAKDDPISVARRALRCQVNQGTDYEWTFDDAIELTNSFAAKHLSSVHKDKVTPEGMILSIAGSFDPAELKKQLNSLIKDWTGPKYFAKDIPKRKFVPGQTLDVPMLRDQAVLMFGRPSEVTVYDKDRIPLTVLNFIAFHSLGSRIYQLRERTGLFYMAGGGFAAQSGREPGFDYLMALLSPEKFVGAEKAMRGVVEQMADGGVSVTELNESKRLYLNTLVSMASTRASVASALASLESKGLGFDYYQKAWKLVSGMSVEELNSLCKKYGHTDDMVRIRVGRV
jgi:zinc protease